MLHDPLYIQYYALVPLNVNLVSQMFKPPNVVGFFCGCSRLPFATVGVSVTYDLIIRFVVYTV